MSMTLPNHPATRLVAFMALALVAASARADRIDFETGLAEDTGAPLIATPTNAVSFGVGTGSPTLGRAPLVARVGGRATGFAPADTPSEGRVGSIFLTDEAGGTLNENGHTPEALDYFFSFENPIRDLSLDLIDYRLDGLTLLGDSATLTLYGGPNYTDPLASEVYQVPAGLPDGFVKSLSAMLDETQEARSASLTFQGRGDVGTGIDNLTFSTVPEPSSALIALAIIAGAFGYRHRKARAA